MAGRRGKQKGRIHNVFTERLKHLQEDAQKIKDGFRGQGQRPWQVPEEVQDLLDIANLHNPVFNRDELNANYEECYADPDDSGTVGDVVGLKLQLDYVAVEERAFRTRHATVARMFCMAMGRRKGHAVGRVFSNIERQASDAIAAGSAGGT